MVTIKWNSIISDVSEHLTFEKVTKKEEKKEGITQAAQAPKKNVSLVTSQSNKQCRTNS